MAAATEAAEPRRRRPRPPTELPSLDRRAAESPEPETSVDLEPRRSRGAEAEPDDPGLTAPGADSVLWTLGAGAPCCPLRMPVWADCVT